jgi:nifR3 family TIM-barrel protein
VQIGPHNFSLPLCQAGLAGYSDRAMRLVARRRGCPYAVTEALLDVILLAGGQGLARSIDINDEDHPIAGQIMGSEPHTMAAAARILHGRGYDVIDLNFACPVKKIKNKARGGHMLADEPRALSILRAVRDALPSAVLSVKMRRGFDDSSEAEERFFRIFDAAFELGYAAVCVHGRTVEQKYVGRSRWAFLRDLKARYPDRTILGSGDVFTPADAVRMLQTGVDGAWIARGAIGNPWVFGQTKKLLDGADESSLVPPTVAEQRETLSEHFQEAMQIHGEQLAGRRMRKMGIKYSRFHPESAAVKAEFINISSLRDWQRVLDVWYSTDRPGVWPPANAPDEVNEESNDCFTPITGHNKTEPRQFAAVPGAVGASMDAS